MLFAYRTAIQISTGKTPHELLFGRHARLPVDAEFDQPLPLPESANEYVEKPAVRMRQAREIVHGHPHSRSPVPAGLQL